MYQRDEFFELADARGILVFTEFSFANAYYPTNPPFLNTVAAEVRDQTLRLQYHPSILLWSANNEIARVLNRMWYNGGGWGPNPDKTKFHFFVEDYNTVFFDTVLSNLTAVDTGVSLFDRGWEPGQRPSLSTSPSQGNNTRAWPIQHVVRRDNVSVCPGRRRHSRTAICQRIVYSRKRKLYALGSVHGSLRYNLLTTLDR